MDLVHISGSPYNVTAKKLIVLSYYKWVSVYLYTHTYVFEVVNRGLRMRDIIIWLLQLCVASTGKYIFMPSECGQVRTYHYHTVLTGVFSSDR